MGDLPRSGGLTLRSSGRSTGFAGRTPLIQTLNGSSRAIHSPQPTSDSGGSESFTGKAGTPSPVTHAVGLSLLIVLLQASLNTLNLQSATGTSSKNEFPITRPIGNALSLVARPEGSKARGSRRCQAAWPVRSSVMNTL